MVRLAVSFGRSHPQKQASSVDESGSRRGELEFQEGAECWCVAPSRPFWVPRLPARLGYLVWTDDWAAGAGSRGVILLFRMQPLNLSAGRLKR